MESKNSPCRREAAATSGDVRREALVLSAQELEDLTGFKRPSAIGEWLERHKWVHEPALRTSEYPRVAREYFRRRLVNPSAAPAREAQTPLGPNLDFMLKGGAAKTARSM